MVLTKVSTDLRAKLQSDLRMKLLYLKTKCSLQDDCRIACASSNDVSDVYDSSSRPNDNQCMCVLRSIFQYEKRKEKSYNVLLTIGYKLTHIIDIFAYYSFLRSCQDFAGDEILLDSMDSPLVPVCGDISH